MSWLRFSSKAGRIELFAGVQSGNFVQLPIGGWPAHNHTTKNSKGPWPMGTWNWSHFNAHPETGLSPACHTTSYGCYGIHVFAVPNRPGIGVHAGRTGGEDDALGKNTLGCVRVPANAMAKINDLHARDRLTQIVVSA